MKKIFLNLVLIVSLFFCFANAQDAFADASAYVTWTAPTTDEGGGALTGLEEESFRKSDEAESVDKKYGFVIRLFCWSTPACITSLSSLS